MFVEPLEGAEDEIPSSKLFLSVPHGMTCYVVAF